MIKRISHRFSFDSGTKKEIRIKRIKNRGFKYQALLENLLVVEIQEKTKIADNKAGKFPILKTLVSELNRISPKKIRVPSNPKTVTDTLLYRLIY